MYTLSAFERRLIHGDQQRDVRMEAGRVNWVAAQEHSGENIGTTESHSLFVELKEPAPGSPQSSAETWPDERRLDHEVGAGVCVSHTSAARS